jgi:hypothetical protein
VIAPQGNRRYSRVAVAVFAEPVDTKGLRRSRPRRVHQNVLNSKPKQGI